MPLVDANGNQAVINSDGSLTVTLKAGTVDIGKVDQGSAGTSGWIVVPPISTYPSAPTNVTAANADTALTAANTSRTGLIVSNDSTAKLYVLVDKGGAGVASATNFTYVVQAGATLELPVPGSTVPTARIRGFWSAANGSAAVTDIS